MQSALQALVAIDVVQVSRTGPDVQNGYSWTVTFVSDVNAGDVPNLVLNPSGLTTSVPNTLNTTVCADGVLAPAGSPCVIPGSSTRGNQLSGTFSMFILSAPDGMPQLPYNYHVFQTNTTVTGIPYNATEAQLTSLIQSQASSVAGSVAVTRSGPDPQRGYTWTITFTSAAGNFPLVVCNGTGMAVNSTVITKELRQGTLQEAQQVRV